jgi:decaprenylphospho-beta-D-ribofuranose 2-oxidase
MAEWTRKDLAGWGRVPVVPADAARPETLADARRAVTKARDLHMPVLAHGLGRSYGDAALVRDGRVIVTRRLDRMLDFDPNSGWLRAEAGVSYEDILNTFVPRGFFPPVTPGTKFVTLGGALACDVHGKNHHHDGCFSNHVRAFDLLLASGETIRVTRETEPDIFRATVGGLGLTGLILAVEVRLVPIASPLIAMESVRVGSLDEFFAVSKESTDFTHTVSWIDCLAGGSRLGRGIFMRGRHAPAWTEPPTGFGARLGALREAIAPMLGVPFDAPNGLLNRATIATFNEAYFRRHPRGVKVSTSHYEPFFYPLDAVANWNRVYGRRGFYQYQNVLPPDPDNRAIRAVLEAIASSGMASFLAVLKEFGPTDNGGLSFPRPGVTLALDFPNHGEKLARLFDRLDAITLEAGGRVYLAKDARLPRDTFRRMYPGWEAWKNTRDALDPNHLFQSELGRRLGLSGAH